MKKTSLALALCIVAASFSPGSGFASGEARRGPACPPGDLVVNILIDVSGSLRDNLEFYWATAGWRRHIRVWEISPGTYCAISHRWGKFTTIGSPSPAETDPSLGAGIKGAFQEDMVISVSGVLLEEPAWPTHSLVGRFPVQCALDDTSADGIFQLDEASCTGDPGGWPSKYFDHPVVTLDYSRSVYRAGRFGTWIEVLDAGGTHWTGDITDG